MLLGSRDEEVEEDGISLDLLRLEVGDPLVGKAGDRPVDLFRSDDRKSRELGVIGEVRRLEDARSSHHRFHRVVRPRGVDPRAHEPVRMIDAKAVVLGKGLFHPRDEELFALAVGAADVLRRIEDPVAPGLALRVRPARRSAHHVALEEAPGVAPGIRVGGSDLEVGIDREAERACLLPEARVRVVHDHLPERVSPDAARVLLEESRAPFGSLVRIPEAPAAVLWPVAEALVPVGGAERVVERVTLEPAGVLGAEAVDAVLELGSGACLERREGALHEAMRARVRRAMRRASVVRSAADDGRGEHALVHEPFVRAASGERRDGDRDDVSREDRTVVGRGVVGRGLPLRSELDAGEAERACERREPPGGCRVRRASSHVLAGIGRKARVLDREEEPPHPELRQRLVDERLMIGW